MTRAEAIDLLNPLWCALGRPKKKAPWGWLAGEGAAFAAYVQGSDEERYQLIISYAEWLQPWFLAYTLEVARAAIVGSELPKDSALSPEQRHFAWTVAQELKS